MSAGHPPRYSIHTLNLYKLRGWFEGCFLREFFQLFHLLDVRTLAVMFR